MTVHVPYTRPLPIRLAVVVESIESKEIELNAFGKLPFFRGRAKQLREEIAELWVLAEQLDS